DADSSLSRGSAHQNEVGCYFPYLAVPGGFEQSSDPKAARLRPASVRRPSQVSGVCSAGKRSARCQPGKGSYMTAATRSLEGNSEPLAATGIAGLDDVLGGGFTPNRLYLIEGVPGSGKTTLALQYLLEGVRLGEPVLYVTLS